MYSTLYFFCLLSSSLLALTQSSWALRNVTLDDTDSSITWVGNWTTVPPGFSHPLGGSYRVTTDPTAYAEFKFTGIAIHFVSPRFPAVASSKLVINGEEDIAHIVNLEDYETKTTDPEFGQAMVLASATSLDQVEHTVRVSMGGKEGYGVFDAFIYTVWEEGDEAIPAIISIGGFQTIGPTPATATIASAPGTPPSESSSPSDSSPPANSPMPNPPPSSSSSNPGSPSPNAASPTNLDSSSPSSDDDNDNDDLTPQPNPGGSPASLSSGAPVLSGSSRITGSPEPSTSSGPVSSEEDNDDSSPGTLLRASFITTIFAALLTMWVMSWC